MAGQVRLKFRSGRKRSGARGGRSVLYERQDALRAIEANLGAALQGQGLTLLLVGEAGTGKTALLEAAAQMAEGMTKAHGAFLVRRAGGSPVESSLPFAFAEQLFGDLDCGVPPATPAALAEQGPRARRAAIFEAARSALTAWSKQGPVLLLLDDLHWADRDSLELVCFLARRMAGSRVVTVGALRQWPADAAALAATLAREGCARTIEVVPLSEQASSALLTHLVALSGQGARTNARDSREPDPGWAAGSPQAGNPDIMPLDPGGACRGPLTPRARTQAWDLARGNPLLLTEVACIVARSGEVPGGDVRSLASLRRTLVLRQLGGLGPEALACAQAAAVLGLRARLGVLEAMTGLAEDVFVEAFDSLVRAGILRWTDAGDAEFSQELVASSALEDTLPDRRRDLHIRAFEHLAGAGEWLAAAPHAIAADMVGVPRALAVVIEAGRMALASGAISTGLAHLRSAVRLAGQHADAELLGRLADALFAADCPTEAAEVYRTLAECPVAPERRGAILGKLARCEAFAGEIDDAMTTYGEALDQLARPGNDELARPGGKGCGPVSPGTFEVRALGFGASGLAPRGGQAAEAGYAPGSLARVLADRAHAAWEADGPRAALDLLDPASAPVWPAPEPALLGALRAYMCLNLGDPSGLQVIERAAAAARQGRGPEWEESARSLNLFLIHPASLAFVERYDEAHELILWAARQYRSSASLRSGVALAALRASILLNEGNPAGVLAGTQETGGGGDLLGVPRLSLLRAEALAWLGRVGESAAICDELEASGGVRSHFAAFCLGTIRAQHLAIGGAYSDAARCYLDLEPAAAAAGVASLATARWAAGAIEANLAAGRPDEAGRLAGWLDRENGLLCCTWPAMLALGGRAGATAEAGDDETANDLYLGALAACSVMPLHRALIGLRYGIFLGRHGKLPAARGLLAEVLATAEARGAAPLAAVAHAELSAAGGRRRRARGAGGLSDQERRVAELAAGGASVKEMARAMYLSARTVETHLSHAYAKLGVRNKADLRRWRADLDL